MKIAIVIQRFSSDLTGGAEYHSRQVALHLSEFGHDVTVLTSTARDARRWTNFYRSGVYSDEKLRVIRFPIEHRLLREIERTKQSILHLLGLSPVEFKQAWTTWANPFVPKLVEHLNTHFYDVVFFFTYSYYPSLVGSLRAKTFRVGVPLAHDEPEFYSPVVQRMMSSFDAIIVNTQEELELIQSASKNHKNKRIVPTVIAGCGVEPPTSHVMQRPLESPYIVYLGRMKDGTEILQEGWRLFQFKYGNTHFPVGSVEDSHMELGSGIRLVTVGDLDFKQYESSNWLVFGHVAADERWAWCAHSELLVNPSLYESLSLTLLEAWWVKRPVLVQARCRVMVNQVARAQGGSTFKDAHEFADQVAQMLSEPKRRATYGQNGQRYVQERYTWTEVMKHYQHVLTQVQNRF